MASNVGRGSSRINEKIWSEGEPEDVGLQESCNGFAFVCSVQCIKKGFLLPQCVEKNQKKKRKGKRGFYIDSSKGKKKDEVPKKKKEKKRLMVNEGEIDFYKGFLH